MELIHVGLHGELHGGIQIGIYGGLHTGLHSGIQDGLRWTTRWTTRWLVCSTQTPYIQSIDAIYYVVAGIPALQPTGRPASIPVLLSGAGASSRPGCQGPRPASIPVPLNGAGASTPQRQEALPYLCDWDYGAGGWEKHEIPQSQGKALPYRIPTG